MELREVRSSEVIEGDLLVFRVRRVLGMQGRKPSKGSALLRIEYEDGTSETFREDQLVTVIREG